MPAWVGNDTFFSDDNIEYHVRWLDCAKEHPEIGPINWLGIWNERSWRAAEPAFVHRSIALSRETKSKNCRTHCALVFRLVRVARGSAEYVKATRRALDAAGHSTTRLVLPDSLFAVPDSLWEALATDSELVAAVGAVGTHYACDAPEEVRERFGLKYWSSEDFSTVSDWAGAGC